MIGELSPPNFVTIAIGNAFFLGHQKMLVIIRFSDKIENRIGVIVEANQ